MDAWALRRGKLANSTRRPRSGRAGPRNAQSRGSRQPVRFGGTPRVHRHRLAEPYRCATGGLRRAPPVPELWPLRRRHEREASTGLIKRSWTGCARRDRGHGCVGSLHSRGREPWRRTGFGYCPQPGATRSPCISGHTNPRSLALVAPRRTGPALCPSLIATRSVQQAHPPTVPSAGRDGRALPAGVWLRCRRVRGLPIPTGA